MALSQSRSWHGEHEAVNISDRANLVVRLVVVVAIGDSLAVVRSLCGVELKHAVDVHCTHSLSCRYC